MQALSCTSGYSRQSQAQSQGFELDFSPNVLMRQQLVDRKGQALTIDNWVCEVTWCMFLQLMQDLTQPRPLEADRREFFCQVEAFAGLVVLNVVPLAGAAPPMALACSPSG